MALGFRETYKATEGQTVFRTPQPYVVGSGTLYVYVNGLTSGIGDHLDYIELDERSIQFNYELGAGDLVTLATSTIDRTLGVDVVGFRNAVFLAYGSENRLKSTQSYEVDLLVKDKRIKWGFSSRFSPMYSAENLIRLLTGGLLASVTNEQINYLIYNNSKEMDQIILSRGTDVMEPTFTEKEWVKFKTCLDIVNAAYLTVSGQKGSISKSIGELKIQKEIGLPYLADMIRYLKDQFDKIDRSVTKPFISQSFRKANSNEYPIGVRRSF